MDADEQRQLREDAQSARESLQQLMQLQTKDFGQTQQPHMVSLAHRCHCFLSLRLMNTSRRSSSGRSLRIIAQWRQLASCVSSCPS
mmetsp:Transcript_35832/g.89252  ORF Transcript_35832/g.89252 Transcript_35832/m.89252 type:complete len:86 (+) Transcript_35832:206-463(+)